MGIINNRTKCDENVPHSDQIRTQQNYGQAMSNEPSATADNSEEMRNSVSSRQ